MNACHFWHLGFKHVHIKDVDERLRNFSFQSDRQLSMHVTRLKKSVSACCGRTCHVMYIPAFAQCMIEPIWSYNNTCIIYIRSHFGSSPNGFRSIYLTLRSVTQNNVAQAIIGIPAGYTAYPLPLLYNWCNSEGSVQSWLRTLHEPLHVVAKPLKRIELTIRDCSSNSSAEERPIAGSSIDIAQQPQWRIMKMTTGVKDQQQW